MDMIINSIALKFMATSNLSFVKSKTIIMDFDEHTDMVPMDVDYGPVLTKHDIRLGVQINK